MSESALAAAIVAKDPEDLRAAVYAELIPVIPEATDPQTWDPRELGVAGGNIWKAVGWREKLWWLDPDDATTAHDAITCIVTVGAYRYKIADAPQMPRSVLSRVLVTPPTSLSVPPVAFGDAYLVPAAATDDWAGHEDEVAIYTARGWMFFIPPHGTILYLEGELGYVHFSAADAWVDGFGVFSLLDNSVAPRHLLIRDWAVENQTTNAPPALGPAGEQYVIGPVPTGAWAGKATKIAYRPALNAAFVILTPFIGEQVADKAAGIPFRWSGTAWVSAGAVALGRKGVETTNGGFFTSGGINYVWSPVAGPQKATHWSQWDTITLTYAAKAAGNVLRFKYTGTLTNSADDAYTFGLLRDAETVPLDFHGSWLVSAGAGHFNIDLLCTAADAAAHTYQIIIAESSGVHTMNSMRRLFEVIEYLP
jgi:hypothetical protein